VADAFEAKRFPHVAIIDRSGSVVIFAKSGKMGADEWTGMLKTHQEGKRPGAGLTRRVSYKLSGDAPEPSAPVYRNHNYCPSCQRRSM
jgi:hypothetical protein